MNLLAVYDMCGSYAETARLVSCSPNTVKNHVVARAAGRRVGERRVGGTPGVFPGDRAVLERDLDARGAGAGRVPRGRTA